jgi:hypothetical protein
MAYLTSDQIALYAAAAGAPDPRLAAAIAMAESGGNTSAHNALPPDDSYGLWQINMIGAGGPDRRRALGITTNAQLYDPATNARAMMLVSGGGTNFTPWSAYTSGRYQKYLPAGSSTGTGGMVPAGWVPSPGDLLTLPGDIVGGLIDGGGNILSGGWDALKWLSKAGLWLGKASNWLRIAYVIGGGALVVVGLALVAKDTELQTAAGQLGKIAKRTGIGIPKGKGST